MNTNSPVRIPWTGRDVPHASIEVNDVCNIHCEACYKIKGGRQKDLAQLKAEIDSLARLRRLGSLTLAGGEPTIHPQLAEVIKYISQKGIRPLLLTNGSLLDAERLAAYKKAGLKRIFLHIDMHQHKRPDAKELDQDSLQNLRKRYIEAGRQAGISVSPTVTLYRDGLKDLLGLVELCLADDDVDILLATEYAQALCPSPDVDASQDVDNVLLAKYLAENLHLQPAWYIPSTHSKQHAAWLFYLIATSRDGQGQASTFHFDPRYPRALRWLPQLARRRYGHYPFDEPFAYWDSLFFVVLFALGAMRPGTWRKALRFVWRALRNKNARVLRLVFQQAPRQLASGEIESCSDCPDACIKDGELVNLCLVDVLDPPPKVKAL